MRVMTSLPCYWTFCKTVFYFFSYYLFLCSTFHFFSFTLLHNNNYSLLLFSTGKFAASYSLVVTLCNTLSITTRRTRDDHKHYSYVYELRQRIFCDIHTYIITLPYVCMSWYRCSECKTATTHSGRQKASKCDTILHHHCVAILPFMLKTYALWLCKFRRCLKVCQTGAQHWQGKVGCLCSNRSQRILSLANEPRAP